MLSNKKIYQLTVERVESMRDKIEAAANAFDVNDIIYELTDSTAMDGESFNVFHSSNNITTVDELYNFIDEVIEFYLEPLDEEVDMEEENTLEEIEARQEALRSLEKIEEEIQEEVVESLNNIYYQTSDTSLETPIIEEEEEEMVTLISKDSKYYRERMAQPFNNVKYTPPLYEDEDEKDQEDITNPVIFIILCLVMAIGITAVVFIRLLFDGASFLIKGFQTLFNKVYFPFTLRL